MEWYKKYSRNIYLFGLFTLVAAMPLSVFVMSVAQFILAGNWLLEGGFRNKFSILKSRRSLWIFMSIFLLHLIGLLYTSDFQYALSDLKVKAPLVILPLIIGTSEPINQRIFKWILYIFSLACFVGSVVSTFNFFGLTDFHVSDIRNISVFISHIRFALMINLAVFALFYLYFRHTKFQLKPVERYLSLLLVLWFIAFLFVLQSVTGLVIFLVVLMFILAGLIFSSQKQFIKTSGLIVFLIVVFAVISLVHSAISQFYNAGKIDFANLDKYTKSGTPYYNDTTNKSIENGNFVFVYMCEPELKNEWNKKSRFGYDGKDKKNQDIKYTLIRYLASKGLRKDAEGVAALTESDISAIENGFTNYRFTSGQGLQKRLYETVWEIDQYLKGANPSGHSLIQRIEFFRTGYHIFKQNFLIGVGTGDVQLAFNKQYENDNSKLELNWRLRAHNQFLTMLVTFGILGFIWFIVSLFLPVWIEKRHRDFFTIIFLLISVISMLNEDTLETQAGITFFCYFYALFVFSKQSPLPK